MIKLIISIFGCLLLITSSMLAQNENEILKIGDKFGGGIIYFIDDSGEHGLIAAPTDQSNGIRWGCTSKKVNATYISNGELNTEKIVKFCGTQNAAGICHDLVLEGFDDWYLPSLEELKPMWTNRLKIENLTTDMYCSSTEHSERNNDCWGLNFSRNGKVFYYNKGSKYSVRAIRKF